MVYFVSGVFVVTDLITRADYFAEQAHAGQQRKYTCEPYIVHPRAVAAIVLSVTDDEAMIAAALLHDVIEDCGVDAIALKELFGADVAQLVVELTDVSKPSDGNRRMRKALDREHIAAASSRAKTIKLADLIDNTSSIVEHDKDFARVYMREKAKMMPALIDGDRTLYARAMQLIDKYRGNL